MPEGSGKAAAHPLAWLLGADNPSVRLFTLTDLLRYSPHTKEVAEARCHIMEVGPVPRILDGQDRRGCWGKPEDFYLRSKYKGTVWTLLLLAELGADGHDPRLRRACEFILTYSQDRQSGGFACQGTRRVGGDPARVIPCLTGNLLWCLQRLGWHDDERVRRGLAWITRYGRLDDGSSAPPAGWPYDQADKCWGRHTCLMGVVKCLKALAEIPPAARSRAVNAYISQAAEWLLRHHLFKRSHDLARLAQPAWLRFGFPRLWNTDVLEMLGLLMRLGCEDGRMRDAIDLVIAKQDLRGRWSLEDSFDGRLLVHLEKPGRPSKWITLQALRVLKAFYSWKAFGGE